MKSTEDILKKNTLKKIKNSNKENINWNLTIVNKHWRWLNTVLAVCEYMLFAKSWQEKGCSSQAETWQVKNTLMKDFDWQVKCDILVVSMVTWMIEYNLKISLLLSQHKIPSLDFPEVENTMS